MVRAVCSGSFDPVTYGHIDIFERASRMYDELIVGVLHNIKKKPFFSVEERVELIKEATSHIKNVKVVASHGLITDFLHEHGATVNVRGLRSVTDFEYEIEQAQTLKYLAPDLETVFLLTKPQHSFISSSAVRELVTFGATIEELVPPCVLKAIKERAVN